MSIDIPMRGELPRTHLCQGPAISKDRGVDFPCCALCNCLRTSVYRDKGALVENPLALEFIEKYSLGMKVCMVSRCNEKAPVVFHYKCVTEQDVVSYANELKQQCLVRKEMKIVDNIIDKKYFTSDQHGLPILIPHEDTKRVEFKGNDGIELNEDKTALAIVDFDKAYEAGTWMYVLNYYQALNTLAGVVPIPGEKVVGEKTWYSLF